MKHFFNDEIEGYTSTPKYTILALTILTAFVFIGWLATTLTGIADLMIEMSN